MAKNYTIDTVGNLFPAVQGDDNSSFFRIAAVLKDPIDAELYQKSLELVFRRFSFFFVRLRKGVFWNYLEECKDLCVAQEEKDLPCSPMKAEKGKSNLIRFLYFQNRIAIEVSHIITDGTGCLELLKAVLFSYFTLKKGEFDSEGKILSLDEIPTIRDYESSFSRYAETIKVSKTKKVRAKRSYRIRGFIPLEKGTHVVTGCASTQGIKAVAKKHGTTITGYLCTLLMFAIFSERIKYEKNKRPIVVAIPANLRNLFPSASLKNFFAVPNVSYEFNQMTTFEEVVASINEQMKTLYSNENLEKEILRYTAFEGNALASFIPLSIKNVFIKLGFSLYGEAKKTITLTNIGSVDLPKAMKKHIELFEMVLYPTKMSPMNVAVASFMDNLTVSFSLALSETDIIRTFFTLLNEHLETDVAVYSTRRGEYYDL